MLLFRCPSPASLEMAVGPLTKGFRSTMEDRGDISAAVKALNNPAIRDATALWLAASEKQRVKLREQFYELIARRRAQLALEATATRDGERGDHVSVEKPVDSASTSRCASCLPLLPSAPLS